MIHFGFSYVGLIYLIMLFIPNIIWTKNQPKDYMQYVQNENRFLRIMEKIGQASVCCFVLIFSDFNVRLHSIWSIWLLISFLLMLLYEVFWIRYFKSRKTMSDFYRSICGVPVAGAALPVCAFFFLGVYGSNVFLIISTIILGIGHIGIHLGHYKEICGSTKNKPVFLRIAKWVINTIFIAILGLVTVIIGCRNFNYITSFIHTDKGVDEGRYVTLGGQEQYLLIKGQNVENPVIIYLHGGPSSPDSFINYTFQKYLTDEYTVVSWDQRGCGRTYFKNAEKDFQNETASFEQAQSDLDELVTYIIKRFNTEKVIIIGHSYGTMLGSQYVINHPEKVKAYIGVGQVVSIESDIYSYKDALEKAAASGDDTSALEMAYKKYVSQKTLTSMMDLRKQTGRYHTAPRETNTIWKGIVSPYMGVDDLRWFLKQAGNLDKYIALNQQLFDYIMTTNVLDYGLEYQVPVGFISGSEDWITPVKYSEDYYHLIDAPQKQFCLIEGCGHSPQFDAPEEFCNALKSILNESVSLP